MKKPNAIQIESWLNSQGVEFVSREMLHVVKELLLEDGTKKVSSNRMVKIAEGYRSDTSFLCVLGENILVKEKYSYKLRDGGKELVEKILSLCPVCGSSRIKKYKIDDGVHNAKDYCENCHSERKYKT